jgi:hypothetical protein
MLKNIMTYIKSVEIVLHNYVQKAEITNKNKEKLEC